MQNNANGGNYIGVDPLGRQVHVIGQKAYELNTHQLIWLNGAPVHANKRGDICSAKGEVVRTREEMDSYTRAAEKEEGLQTRQLGRTGRWGRARFQALPEPIRPDPEPIPLAPADSVKLQNAIYTTRDERVDEPQQPEFI